MRSTNKASGVALLLLIVAMSARVDAGPCVASSYTIQSGDICSDISARFGITLDDLYRLNPFINKPSCNNLYPGQSLNVCPTTNSGATAAVPQFNPAAGPGNIPVPPPPAPTCNKWYTIVAGDTCLALASKNGLYFNTFMSMNKALKCDRMYPGDKICVGASNLPTFTVPTCSRKINMPKYESCGSLLSSYPKLYALNPALDCNNLQWDQPICVEGSSSGGGQTSSASTTTQKVTPPTSKPTTTVARAFYTPSKYCVTPHKVASASETCNSIVQKYSINYNSFISINPGIQCHTLRAGDELCVRAVNQPLYKPVTCLLKLTISPSYQCTLLSLIYKNFLAINPGINCDNLQYDQSVCIQGF